MLESREHSSRNVVGSYVGNRRVAAGAQQEVIFASQGRSNNKREVMLENRERSDNIQIRNQQDRCVVESQERSSKTQSEVMLEGQERSSKNVVGTCVGKSRAQRQERSRKLCWKSKSVAARTQQEVIFESQEHNSNKQEVLRESQECSSKNTVGLQDFILSLISFQGLDPWGLNQLPFSAKVRCLKAASIETF